MSNFSPNRSPKRLSETQGSYETYRNRYQSQPRYSSPTFNRTQPQINEEFVVGCSLCGSRAIDEISNRDSPSPPRLRPHCKHQLESLTDPNSGNFTVITKVIQRDRIEGEKSGVSVKKVKNVQGQVKNKKMKVKTGSGSTVVVYAQEVAKEQSGLTPLNYQDWYGLKESLIQSGSARDYVKDEERRIVNIRRHEYANQIGGTTRDIIVTNVDCNQILQTPAKTAQVTKVRNVKKVPRKSVKGDNVGQTISTQDASPTKRNVLGNRQNNTNSHIYKGLNYTPNQQLLQQRMQRELKQGLGYESLNQELDHLYDHSAQQTPQQSFYDTKYNYLGVDVQRGISFKECEPSEPPSGINHEDFEFRDDDLQEVQEIVVESQEKEGVGARRKVPIKFVEANQIQSNVSNEGQSSTQFQEMNEDIQSIDDLVEVNKEMDARASLQGSSGLVQENKLDNQEENKEQDNVKEQKDQSKSTRKNLQDSGIIDNDIQVKQNDQSQRQQAQEGNKSDDKQSIQATQFTNQQEIQQSDGNQSIEGSFSEQKQQNFNDKQTINQQESSQQSQNANDFQQQEDQQAKLSQGLADTQVQKPQLQYSDSLQDTQQFNTDQGRRGSHQFEKKQLPQDRRSSQTVNFQEIDQLQMNQFNKDEGLYAAPPKQTSHHVAAMQKRQKAQPLNAGRRHTSEDEYFQDQQDEIPLAPPPESQFSNRDSLSSYIGDSEYQQKSIENTPQKKQEVHVAEGSFTLSPSQEYRPIIAYVPVDKDLPYNYTISVQQLPPNTLSNKISTEQLVYSTPEKQTQMTSLYEEYVIKNGGSPQEAKQFAGLMGSFADAKVIKALKFMGGFVEYLEEKGGMLDSQQKNV